MTLEQFLGRLSDSIPHLEAIGVTQLSEGRSPALALMRRLITVQVHHHVCSAADAQNMDAEVYFLMAEGMAPRARAD